MDDLKPCLLPCNLEQLNDRINNLSTGLTSMSSKDVMRVNKIFLTEVLNYMEELLGLRREEENRRTTPENKPLTLEQLRQMDGEPVWIVMLDGSEPTRCEIVVECYKDGIKMASTEYTDDYGAFDLYGKTWLAYARKPEGSEP